MHVAWQVVCDIPAAEKLAQEADDIEEAMATEFASRSAQVCFAQSGCIMQVARGGGGMAESLKWGLK